MEAVGRRRSTAFWLTTIGLAALAALLASAWSTKGPSIFPDEFVYWQLQHSLGESGRFVIFGTHFSPWSYGVLYPLLLAPLARLPLSTTALYHVDQTVSCILFATAVVPAYLLSRRILERRSALLLTAFLLAIPSDLYATHVMTEGLGYPLFLWAFLASWDALERPGWRSQLPALTAIALTTLTRAELVVLLPAYLCALLVVRRRFTALAVSGVVIAAVAALAASSAVWSTLIGAHRSLFSRFSPAEAPRWAIYNLIGIEVYVGVIPFVLALVVLARWLRGRDTRRRNLAVLTIALAAFLLALIGTYVTQRPTAGVYDRYTFYLAPLVLLGFADWVQRRTPIGARTRLVLGLLILAPLVLPYWTLFRKGWGLAVNLGLLPLFLVRQGSWIALYLVLSAALALAVRLFLRATSGGEVRPLVVAVVSGVGFVTLLAHATNTAVAAKAHRCLSDPHWIDRRDPPIRDAVVLWRAHERHQPRCAIWESVFFNQALVGFYRLGPSLGGLPEPRLVVRQGRLLLADGRALRARYVVTNTALVGRLVARDPKSRLRLYATNGTVELAPRANRT